MIAVRPMMPEDVSAACRILNVIIEIGGSTALEIPFSEALFAQSYLGWGGQNLLPRRAGRTGRGGGVPMAGRRMTRCPKIAAISQPSPAAHRF